MKITKVKALVVSAPPHRNWIFVKVETDHDGLYGWGEATLEWKTRAVVGCVEDFEPIVLGRDPRDVTRIVELLNKAAFWPLGVIGLTALSAIEQACWDIKAKDLGIPVWAALGGKVRDRVRVYTHIGSGKVKVDRAKRDIGEYAESAAELREIGYTAFKTGPAPYTALRARHEERPPRRQAAGRPARRGRRRHGHPARLPRPPVVDGRGAGLYRRGRAGDADVRGRTDPARRSGGHAHGGRKDLGARSPPASGC